MSKKICQIVDSSGGLPREFIRQYSISEVPFYFKFGSTDYYRENDDYGINEFYQHMEEHPDDVPKTSAPNIHDWLAVFEEQYARGAREYIVTTISSKLSASYQAATSAREIFEERNREAHIEVINSNTCACGQGALEIEIARMIDSARKFGDIIEAIHKMTYSVNSLFVVDSLKYMKAGGRIGKATASLGTMLNIKPVSEFIDGEVHLIKKIHGRRKSLKAMIDIALSRIVDIDKATITIQNAACQEDADYMCRYLREKTSDRYQVFTRDLGIAVGAHSGPGAIGIGFVEHPRLP